MNWIRFWRFAGAVLILMILSLGLNPKDYRFVNNTAWLPDGRGVQFKKYSIAHSEPVLPQVFDTAFSLEIEIKPRTLDRRMFSLIMVVHGGDDESQFALGQWRNQLIVMNGDDYAYRRKLKRLVAPVEKDADEKMVIFFTSDSTGSCLYVNAQAPVCRSDVSFSIPHNGVGNRLILGNSASGTQSWEGEIHRLALFADSLTPEKRARFDDNRTILDVSSDNLRPTVFYPMIEGDGNRLVDWAGEADLIVPKYFTILNKQFLSLPDVTQVRIQDNVKDWVLNFLAFMPLGVFLSLAGRLDDRRSRLRSISLVVVAGFLLSLFIETIQVWLPSRISSASDLFLNTFGVFMGSLAVLYYMPLHQKLRKANSRSTNP